MVWSPRENDDFFGEPQEDSREPGDCAADARKPCTCDGAGRGPGRACVVKAGGSLGELWRCAETRPAAKIEARAAELHEGCQMPMEQARELAVSEAGDGAWRCIAPACKPLGCSMCNCAIPADVYAALLGPMQAQIDQKHAEYLAVKQCLRLAVDHIAALNGALDDLASLGATIAICGSKYDDAAARMVLGPNVM